MSNSRKWLDQITSEAAKRGEKTVLSGSEGVGKTSTAAHFPEPVFLFTGGEDSLGVLQSNGEIPKVLHFPPMDSFADVMQALEELKNSPKIPKTLVLDSLDGFEALAKEHVLQTKYGGSISKFSAWGGSEGWSSVCSDWGGFLNVLHDIAVQGTNVVLLAHVEVAKVPNPGGTDYIQWRPAGNKRVWPLTARWCDNILQISCIESVTDDGKASGTSTRVLYTTPNPQRVCKNRHSLDEQHVLGSSPKAAAKMITDALNL